MQTQEVLTEELQPVQVLSRDEKIQAVIQNIEDGNLILSFTAIKEFAKSPYHFIQYKIREKKQTAAMKQGSLIHCAILEPEELEKRYCILKNEDLPNPEADFRNSDNKKFKQNFEARAEAEGKEIVSPSDWDDACMRRDLAYGNEVIAPFLTGLKHREYAVEWEFEGFKWRGVIDGLGKNYVLDLKTVANALPEKANYTAKQEKYHWQQFLYKQSKYAPFYFDNYNLLIDAECGMTLLKIEFSALSKAEADLIKTIEQLKICIENRLWNQNFEFWAKNNQGVYIFE